MSIPYEALTRVGVVPHTYSLARTSMYRGGFKSRKQLRRRARARRKAIIRRMPAIVAPVYRRRRNIRYGGFLGLELKFLDCAWNNVTLNASSDGSGGELQPSSGCTNAISVPAQGDGESERDGRKYTIKSIWLSGVVKTSPNSDANDAQEMPGYFLALVLDTQANGATLSTEDVYLNPSSQTEAMLPQPLRNLQNSKRFRILATKYIRPGGTYAQSDGSNTASQSNQTLPIVTMNWRGNIICDSIGTTANVASASDNAVHLVGFTGNTTLTPSFSGKSRVRFMG